MAGCFAQVFAFLPCTPGALCGPAERGLPVGQSPVQHTEPAQAGCATARPSTVGRAAPALQRRLLEGDHEAGGVGAPPPRALCQGPWQRGAGQGWPEERPELVQSLPGLMS